MAIKIFVEYKVLEEKREAFLQLIPELQKHLEEWNADQFQIYEGIDQPMLFVEEFYLPHVEQYKKLKEARMNGDAPFWKTFNACIAGGGQNVHVWAFRKLNDLALPPTS
ncbi:hypothetical protein BSNK01_28150 [Bacillaceae bacterium]